METVPIVAIVEKVSGGAVLLRPPGEDAEWIPASLIDDNITADQEGDVMSVAIATWKLEELMWV